MEFPNAGAQNFTGEFSEADKENDAQVSTLAHSTNDGEASSKLTATAGGIGAKFSQKLEALRKQKDEKQAFDENTTDHISGLRIVNWLLPKARWEQSMAGKRVVPFTELHSIKEKSGRDNVVVGVLWKPADVCQSLCGKCYAGMSLANLDKRQNLTVELVLEGRAKDHWVDDGPGRAQASVGSIFAALNPAPTQRSGTLRINFETQLVKVGNSSALGHCSAMLSCGKKCSMPYNKEGEAEYCFQHAAVSHHARYLQSSNRQDRHASPWLSTRRGNTQKSGTPPASLSSVMLGEKRKRNESNADTVTAPHQVSSTAPGIGALFRAESAVKEAKSASQALIAIEALEAMDVTAPMLKRTKLYDELGSAISRWKGVDRLAESAHRVRRRWRAVLAEDT